MIRFHSPWSFLLLLLIPFLLRWMSRNKSEFSIRFSSGSDVYSLPGSFREKCAAYFLPISTTVILTLLVTAMARPQTGTYYGEVDASGRDIILALDLSGSMQAVDFSLENQRVDRLTALKSVVKDFIDKRKDDRIGLVVFGEEAMTLCPLTLDHHAVKELVDGLQIGMLGQGTAIGDAIGISLKRIRDIDAKSRVVVLVTDGQNNSGRLLPSEAAGLAKSLEVTIHTVGIGGEGPAPFPVQGLLGTHYVSRPMEYDEKSLKEISEISGGLYFNAKDTDGLVKVYREIDALVPREEKTQQHIAYTEHAGIFILWAMGILLFQELLLATWLMEVTA